MCECVFVRERKERRVMMKMSLILNSCIGVYSSIRHVHTHNINGTATQNIPSTHIHIHTALGNWGPLGPKLWVWVPRAQIPYREADKSTVNKPASTEALFTTALSTRPVPPAQLWSHTHLIFIRQKTPKIHVPIQLYVKGEKKLFYNVIYSAFFIKGSFFSSSINP